MGYEFILYEVRNNVAYITLNRPRHLNALHPPANQELEQAWREFEANPDAHVAVLSGAGDRAFSAGNDLKYTAEHPEERGRPQTVPSGGFGGLTTPRMTLSISKPIIAAVHGYALGGGFEMALASDIVIAADDAQFGLPEPLRGIAAGAGGYHRLPRQVPLKVAMGMLLTGRFISAQEAYRLGLVNEVVPRGKLMETAERWAQEIIVCAPLSVRGTKQAAMEGLGYSLPDAFSRRYPWMEAAMSSEDSIEGPKAFAEKRKPVWKGH